MSWKYLIPSEIVQHFSAGAEAICDRIEKSGVQTPSFQSSDSPSDLGDFLKEGVETSIITKNDLRLVILNIFYGVFAESGKTNFQFKCYIVTILTGAYASADDCGDSQCPVHSQGGDEKLRDFISYLMSDTTTVDIDIIDAKLQLLGAEFGVADGTDGSEMDERLRRAAQEGSKLRKKAAGMAATGAVDDIKEDDFTLSADYEKKNGANDSKIVQPRNFEQNTNGTPSDSHAAQPNKRRKFSDVFRDTE